MQQLPPTFLLMSRCFVSADVRTSFSSMESSSIAGSVGVEKATCFSTTMLGKKQNTSTS